MMTGIAHWQQQFGKPVVFILCLLPFLILLIQLLTGYLGANPIEAFTRNNGEWGLRFLLITLAVTPLRKIFNISWLQRYRRMLGLYTFFYVFIHLCSYLMLDLFFDWKELWLDIVKRPYITIGMTAFVLLLPLVVTSNSSMMKRLGRNWARLHKLVYLIAILGIIHFFLLVKADLLLPTIYAVMLVILLSHRIFLRYKR